MGADKSKDRGEVSERRLLVVTGVVAGFVLDPKVNMPPAGLFGGGELLVNENIFVESKEKLEVAGAPKGEAVSSEVVEVAFFSSPPNPVKEN